MTTELRAPLESLADCLQRIDPAADATTRAMALLADDVPLEQAIARAAAATEAHFARPDGRRRVLLYAPLYLSSHCVNHCVYCGFRHPAEIERRHLDAAEIKRQAQILIDRGFRHILLVGGDCPALTTTEYYVQAIRLLVECGVTPAVEIAPQSTDSYAAMADAGACGVTLYQETYNRDLYALYHPRGPKASYDWRLEGLERAAEAGMRRLGLGVLLGLADPREDLAAMIRHAGYLRARFPQNTIAFSLPRIHEAPADFETPYPVDDDTFIRLYCALRVAMPEAELVLSTREPAALRDRLVRICITQLSAGSSTTPGGYTSADDRPGGQQFPVCDHRPVDEVAQHLEAAGLQPTWQIP